MSKKIGGKKIFAQLLVVSCLFALCYFAIMRITESSGGDFKRKDVIAKMRHNGEGQELTKDLAQRIVERKKAQDSKSMTFLIVGACLVGLTYGVSLIKKK
ncbi:hypothetical protein N9O57_00755 [bacterium]|nr:hypothetical protein [bacterium]